MSIHDLKEIAKKYYDAGLNILPASSREKRPLCAWKRYIKQRPTFDEVFSNITSYDALALVCGETSGGVEVVDFDQQAAAFPAFWNIEKETCAGCVVETSQSGGKHLIYRREDCGSSLKLASNEKGVLIETRGRGGICIISPSVGYTLERGDFTRLPILSRGDCEKIFTTARIFDEIKKELRPVGGNLARVESVQSDGDSVAERLRNGYEWLDSLQRAGWLFLFENENYFYFSRPFQNVKGKIGGSFSKIDKFFHCFTSNAPPLTVDTSYSPLQLIAALDFDGDESRAAKAHAPKCQGGVIEILNDFEGVENELQCSFEDGKKKEEKEEQPPLTFPGRLYSCGGLIQELFETRDRFAIRPQPEGAFLGALADMSFLAGRSMAVNFCGQLNFPNLYALFLAPSGMGKETIRRVGAEVVSAYRPAEQIPEGFASVQALQNMTVRLKKLYWLNDEFGRDLQVMNGARNNANITNIITECLKLYSNSNNRHYLPRVVAQDAKTGDDVEAVDRPSLTIFATGNPSEFFDAAGENLLQNGYLARFTIVKGRDYSEKKTVDFYESQEAPVLELSRGAKKIIQNWVDVENAASNDAYIVGYNQAAFDCFKSFDEENEKKIKEILESQGGGVEFFARFSEKVWKYAILFAVSKQGGGRGRTINGDDMERAVDFARYERDTIMPILPKFEASPVSKLASNAIEWAQKFPSKFFKKADFTRRFWRKSAKEREEVLQTLIDGDYIEPAIINEGEKKTRGFLVK